MCNDEKDALNPQISRVAVKPPPFWKNNPMLWFAQIEAQFSIADITQDNTKFNHVVAAIESDILNSVHDLILKPPDRDRYVKLKERLIEIYSESETSKIRTLLQGLELGDQRPSYLLSRMRDLAGNHFSDDLLKSLWLSRLPNNIQIILAASNEDLTKLASMADKINELVIPGCINSTQVNSPPAPSIEKQVAELSKQVNELSALLHDSRQRPRFRNNRNQSRNRERSQSRRRISRQYKEPSNGLCFYHTNFGVKARKCSPPCSFQQSGN